MASPFVHAPLFNSTRYYYSLTAVDGPSESEASTEVSASTVIDAGTKLMAPDAQRSDRFGHAVALSGDDAIVGAVEEDGASDDPFADAGAAYVFHFSGSSWDAGTKLVAPDAQEGDRFGSSVAISGELAIVGARCKDGGESYPPDWAGAAYVFHFNGSSWDAGTKLVAPDVQGYDSFGISAALSGDYAIVGAFQEDGGDGDPLSDAGAAYVFHFNGSSWEAGTKLVASDAQKGDEFGRSVALSGDFAIVGAVSENGGDGDLLNNAGAAYVFHFNGSSWEPGPKLVAPDAQEGDGFGISVALSGDYAIIGASQEDGGAGDALSDAGAAYVFHFNGSSWDAGPKLVAPDAQEYDSFGISVALSGDYAIVGARFEDGGDGDMVTAAGAAYVFHFSGSSWDTGTKLVAPDAQAGGYFGNSVALSGNHAIVGASGEDGGDDDSLTDAGAAYVVEY